MNISEKYLDKRHKSLDNIYIGNKEFEEYSKKQFDFIYDLINRGLFFEVLKGEKEFGLYYNFERMYAREELPDQDYGTVYRIVSFLVNEQLFAIETVTHTLLRFFDEPDWGKYIFNYLALSENLSKTFGRMFDVDTIVCHINSKIDKEIYLKYNFFINDFNTKYPNIKIKIF